MTNTPAYKPEDVIDPIPDDVIGCCLPHISTIATRAIESMMSAAPEDVIAHIKAGEVIWQRQTEPAA